VMGFLSRLLGDQPTSRGDAERTAKERGFEIPGPLIQAHLLAGGNIAAVLDAMTLARARGLPEAFALLGEAQLAGLDLPAFVDRGYKDPELKTLTALRAAAQTNPEAATRLAAKLLGAIKDLDAKRAAGATGLGERLAWDGIDRGLRQAQETVAQELRELIPYLPPGAAVDLRNQVERAV
jgi:TPR repeat protein